MNLILKMVGLKMLGILNNFPLFDVLIILQKIVLFVSSILLLFFGLSYNKITNSLMKDENNPNLQLCLIYADKGLKQTCLTIIFSILLYGIFYIMI